MTDTTDIAALREFLQCEIIPNGILRNLANKVLGLLEAERQRAADEQTLLMPDGLHENTKALVIGFANAMAAKLYKAEQKYGWSDAWMQSDWQDKCLADFNHHISKGDPLDVANYCAFMHYHGWPTTTVKVNNIDALEKHTRGIEEAVIAATDEIAALKGDQVPFSYYGDGAYYNTERAALKDGAEEVIPLYDHPQNPVVLPSPYYGDRHCLDKREVIAAIEAAGGIVKDGE